MSTEPKPQRALDMGLLARADAAYLARLFPDLPPHSLLRGPETGTVMVRGRQGGTGTPFNLGEITVARASVRLACGTVGHAHVQGRNKDHARRAAVLDALMQTAQGAGLRQSVLAPLAQVEAAAQDEQARKAAATKVEFFTMVRGESE